MSLLTNPLQSGLLLQQAVLPYTFTTGELDSLKAKLQAAESQMMQQPNKQASMLAMSAAEIRTLLRMIDMTYLQGLSGSGHYVQDCTGAASAMTPMLQHQSQLQQALTPNASALQQLTNNGLNGLNNLSNPSLNGLQQLNQQIQQQQQQHNMSQMSQMSQMGQHNLNGNSSKNPPPANYVCHKCNVVGHWIQECPLNTQQQQDYTKPPPANYVCHRCGIPGHWIKNCPTNGNPTFDNKPHLKVIKQQDGTTITVNTQTNQQVSSSEGGQPSQNGDASTNSNVTTASQPPSKKRRLNQM